DDARGAGADGPVLPADLLGGGGLHVKSVVVTRAAELVQEDHGLGAGAAAPALARFEKIRQQRAEQAQAADLEQAAAGQGPVCPLLIDTAVSHGHITLVQLRVTQKHIFLRRLPVIKPVSPWTGT